jgi:hypothetical protein
MKKNYPGMQLYARRIVHTRPQTLVGALSQLWAAATHHLSPARLRAIARAIPCVLVITGDEDVLVAPTGSERLMDGFLGEVADSDEGRHVELVKWEKTGHALHIQWSERFNALLERVFKEGEEVSTVTD